MAKNLMTRVSIVLFCALIAVMPALAATFGGAGHSVLTREDFEGWADWPEYTTFNPFPFKGANCTWYAHGRMMQLGLCKYTLDSMRFNAKTWAEQADRGAEVNDVPALHSIAYWDGGAFFGSSLGHVAVVEAVMEDGSILVSDSSSSGAPYNTYTIKPGDFKWPTSFIIVPPGKEKSGRFHPGQFVKTANVSLNFRLKGVNQPAVILPPRTVLSLVEHPSNGLYAAQPGSVTFYHYWWYAEAEVEGERRRGWLAETYLEAVEGADPLPDPCSEGPEAGLEPDGEGTSGEEDPQSGLETDNGVVTGEEPGEELEPVSPVITGDVNGDGIIDVRDVVLTMRFALGLESITAEQFQAADANNDGVIDVRDVLIITHYALGHPGSD